MNEMLPCHCGSRNTLGMDVFDKHQFKYRDCGRVASSDAHGDYLTRRQMAVEAWNAYPVDENMEKAFAALADALEAQDAELLQEMVDLWDVWGWIRKYGGLLNENGVVFYSPNAIPTRIDLIHNGEDWRPAAAAWVRQQEGEP